MEKTSSVRSDRNFGNTFENCPLSMRRVRGVGGGGGGGGGGEGGGGGLGGRGGIGVGVYLGNC